MRRREFLQPHTDGQKCLAPLPSGNVRGDDAAFLPADGRCSGQFDSKRRHQLWAYDNLTGFLDPVRKDLGQKCIEDGTAVGVDKDDETFADQV